MEEKGRKGKEKKEGGREERWKELWKEGKKEKRKEERKEERKIKKEELAIIFMFIKIKKHWRGHDGAQRP